MRTQKKKHTIGERLNPRFNRKIKLEFYGARLTSEGDLLAYRELDEEINGRWVQKAMQKSPHNRIILDMDSSESPVHGEQEGSGYNGHFKCNCYHPLFGFNQYGDCEGAMLRVGKCPQR